MVHGFEQADKLSGKKSKN